MESSLPLKQPRRIASPLRMLCAFVTIALGLIFIFSGLAKLNVFAHFSSLSIFSGYRRGDSLQPFEWSFMDIFPIGPATAGIIARVFIALELVLGGMLAAHLFLKSFTYKATMALLATMTIYLVILIAVSGNSGNCGCFGEGLQMTPLAGAIKNIIMMVVVAGLMRYYSVPAWRGSFYAATLIIAAACITPFVQRPLPNYLTGDAVNEPLSLSPLYNGTAATPPATELRSGKHIMAFFSLTCPHCVASAYKLYTLKRQYPEMPVALVLNGRPALLDTFLTETHTRDLPYTFIENTDSFVSMAGPRVPQIFLVNNSRIERRMNGSIRSPHIVLDWLKKK